ncbi:MAG: hypothetical protein AB1486_17495 [Planctomycetota bacterium]
MSLTSESRLARITGIRVAVTWLVAASLVVSGGCATVFRGTSQNVCVSTYPAGGKVLFNGISLGDGQTVTVTKRFETPSVTLDEARPLKHDLTFDADPWLIGDAALLVLGIVPGLVALGIDFGTGAWRNLHERQTILLPQPVSLSAEAAGGTRAESESPETPSPGPTESGR